MNIDGFFQDGANVQAQIIALLLREKHEWILDPTWDKERCYHKGRMTIGRLENCREQGYVVSIRFNGNQRNYAFYEHRNSDRVHILINDETTIDTPSLDMMWEGREDKYDTDKAFDYGEWYECAMWIGKDMIEHLKRWVEDANKEKEIAAQNE